jgi:hypothetical protein
MGDQTHGWMIVAQAKANGLALLVSPDEEIEKHYLRTAW